MSPTAALTSVAGRQPQLHLWTCCLYVHVVMECKQAYYSTYIILSEEKRITVNTTHEDFLMVFIYCPTLVGCARQPTMDTSSRAIGVFFLFPLRQISVANSSHTVERTQTKNISKRAALSDTLCYYFFLHNNRKS